METLEGEEKLIVHRCNYCQILLPEYLLRAEDVKVLKDETWTCHYNECGTKNNFTKHQCEKCQNLVREYEYQPRFLFPR